MNEANTVEVNHLRNLLKAHSEKIKKLRDKNDELRMRNDELINQHTKLLNIIHQSKYILAHGRTVSNNMMYAYGEVEVLLDTIVLPAAVPHG